MEIPPNLHELCKEYFDLACAEEYIDEDLPHYIFEAAMEASLGKDVWDRIRVGQKNHAISKKKKEIARLQKEIQSES